MLSKTRGIVLNYIKYRESSIITKIFTEEFGLQTYIVNGVRSPKSRTGAGLFQSLSLLDLVVYYKPSGSIKRISEVKCSYPFKSIPFQIQKSAIGIFLSDVLNKTLKEEAANRPFFEFLFQSIIDLDRIEKDFENFHLKFLLDLSYFLGFKPGNADDIINNGFSTACHPEEKKFLQNLIELSDTNEKTDNFTRRKSLEHILNFYSAHIENFGFLKSVKVLKEVLS
jgi:DNA repair protein RecO (recombination protein O)